MWTKRNAFQAYFLKKELINFWLVNAVINGVIFYFQISDKTQIFQIHDISMDYVQSLLILGMACALTAFPMIKKDIAKGIVPKAPEERTNHAWMSVFPKNPILISIIVTILVIVTIVPFFAGMPAIFGIYELNFVQAWILKIIATGFAGTMVGYIIMSLLLCGDRRQEIAQDFPKAKRRMNFNRK